MGFGMHSAYFGRFVPHQVSPAVGQGIGRGLPSVFECSLIKNIVNVRIFKVKNYIGDNL